MIVCQRCGRENDGRYRFCLGCGSALAVAPPSTGSSGGLAPPPPPPPVPGLSGGRGEPSTEPVGSASLPSGRATGAVPIAPLPRRPPPAPPGAAPPPQPAPPHTAAPVADGAGRASAAARAGVADSALPAHGLHAGQGARVSESGAAAPRGPSAAGPSPWTPAGSGQAIAEPAPRAPDPVVSRDAQRTGYDRGQPVPGDELRCVQCNNTIPTSYAFCGVCGTPRKRSEDAARAARQPPGREIGALALIDDLGNEAVRYPLAVGENRIGRSAENDVQFPHDGLLAAHHCTLVALEAQFRLRPIDGYNGTYLRISTPVELQHGDILRVGQEVLRFERIEELAAEVSSISGGPLQVGCAMPRGVWGRLCQVGMARQVANAYLLSHRDVFVGRERGDILFPRDGFVSGSHAVISERGGRVYLKDLGSSNGTFVRLKRETPLRPGDLLLLGRNLLRVHVGGTP